jgi:hypothetical protein
LAIRLSYWISGAIHSPYRFGPLFLDLTLCY